MFLGGNGVLDIYCALLHVLLAHIPLILSFLEQPAELKYNPKLSCHSYDTKFRNFAMGICCHPPRRAPSGTLLRYSTTHAVWKCKVVKGPWSNLWSVGGWEMVNKYFPFPIPRRNILKGIFKSLQTVLSKLDCHGPRLWFPQSRLHPWISSFFFCPALLVQVTHSYFLKSPPEMKS